MFEAGSLIFRIQTVGAGLFKSELAQADDAAKKAGRSVSESAKSTNELGRQADYTRPKLRQVSGEIRNMSVEAQGASREVGGAMMLIGAAIVATVGLTVKAATEWESAWAGVRKTLDGTDEEMADVEAGLRAMSKELPASHREIAAVAEAAGQLGVSAENVTAFTRTMIDLGETTNLTSEEAATSLAQLMNVMRTAPEDVGRLGSAVVALGNNGASTERDIVQMAQRIAGAGEVVGLTEGEVLGLANALASVGIEAEAGGSAVSNIMIDISKAVSAGGADLEEWARIAGVTGDEFARRWKADPAEALATVIEGMGRLNSSGGDVFATLTKLGQSDIRVTRALLSLSGAGDLLRTSLETGNRAFEENNALQVEADKRYETTAAKVAMARNSVVDMAIELGEHLLPLVIAAAEGVGDFADMVGGMPEPVQGVVAVLSVLTGLIALSAGAALVAVPKFVEFRLALAALGTEFPKPIAGAQGLTYANKGLMATLGGPWGIAIAGAVAGLVLLNEWLNSTKASTEEMTASVSNGTSTAESMARVFTKGTPIQLNEGLERLQSLLNQMGDNPDAWSTFFSDTATNQLRSTLERVGETLGDVAGTDLPAARRAFMEFAEETDGSSNSIWRLLQAMPEFKQALVESATAAGDYAETMTEAEKRQVLLDYATGRGVGQTESAADAYLEAAEGAREMERDLDSLLALLNEANGVNQDAITSNLDYKNALAEVDETIRLAREGVEGYALGLDENTQVGRDNMAMLVDLAQDAWDAADAQRALDGSVDGFSKRLEESREALVTRAMDFGYTREEAIKLADQILAMPTDYELEVLADMSTASDAINGFIKAFDGRQITLRVGAQGQQTYSRDGQTFYQADGGNIQFFANGGEHHIAQFARAGDMRVWAEPETGGEYYIPASPAKRPRSLQILGQAAAEFGYDLVPAGMQTTGSGSGPIAVEVIVQPRGGIDLLEYIEVTAQAAASDSNRSVNRAAGSARRF